MQLGGVLTIPRHMTWKAVWLCTVQRHKRWQDLWTVRTLSKHLGYLIYRP